MNRLPSAFREIAILLLMLGLLLLIFGFSAASSQFVYIDF